MKVLETRDLDIEKLSFEDRENCYNALDCMVTKEVFDVLEPKMGEAEFPYKMSRAMQGPALTLMTRGVRIDTIQRNFLIHTFTKRQNRLYDILFRLCTEGLGIESYYDKKKDRHYGINPASPKQLIDLFYNILGFPEIKAYNKLTKEYSVSTDRKALEKLEKEWLAKPFCKIILAIRDFDKKIQVLQKGIRKGRMHCSYAVVGTLTGRWASREDAFGDGTNLQNITDEMRRIFIPDPGMKFAQFDLAQAESKLVAYLTIPFTNERAYKNACLSGDLHTTVSKLVWGNLSWGTKPDREIANQPFYRHFSYRDMAKRGGHGTNYGGSSAVIGMHLNIPREQAQTFQDAYFKAFPEIPKWHTDIKIKLATTRMITTPLGRRCFFPGRPTDNDTIKSAIAYGPQSTIGDVLNLGFYNVWQKYDKIFDPNNPMEILTQVHDSILIQYDPKDEDWLLPLIQKEMQVPIEINGEVCEIGVDIQCGWNWGKEKKDNVYGLKDWNGKDDRAPPPETSLLDRRPSEIYRTC